MAQDALSRLAEASDKHEDISIDEQLNSALENEESILDGMGIASKAALYEKLKPLEVEDSDEDEKKVAQQIEEVKYTKEEEEPQIEEVEPEPQKEPEKEPEKEIKEEKVEQKKPKRKTKKKEKKQVEEKDEILETLLDKLADSLLDDLIDSKYKFLNFDKKQTELIIEHIKESL